MSYRPRLLNKHRKAIKYLTGKQRRILIIGDLHCPFEHPDYFDHCVDTYETFACNQVIFIGDLIDSHASSRHETDPDGYSPRTELDMAIESLKKWNTAFPVADVIIGNHDRIVLRKAFSSSIPSVWIKGFNEVLGTNWNWTHRIEYDGVQYIHGEGATAKTRAKNEMQSTVQGHRHTEMETVHLTGKQRIFGMQTGCGIDETSYAMAYAKNYKKPALGVGIVIDGKVAFNVPMLENLYK